MPAIVIKTFADVQAALNKFVTDNKITLGPPHGAFWQNGAKPGDQYDNFVNGKDSNIIKALSGIAPFDRATNPSDPFPQMPAPRGPYLDPETIDAISAWIDAGANQ